MLIRDRKGRLWSGRLTCGSAIFLRDDLSIDVMTWLADWDTAIRDLAAPSIVASCVWGLLHESLERERITDTAFGKQIRNNSHSDLVEIIVDEIKHFVHVPELLPGHAGKSRSTVTSAALWGSVWQMAGICGVDPLGLSYGQLVALSDARRKHLSAANALLACVVANAQGGKTKPADFDPTGFLGASIHSEPEVVTQAELAKLMGIEIKERKVNGTE